MPPSLKSEELRAIQREERKQRSPTVRPLLWEVFRLRSIALRADQLLRSMNSDPASLSFNSLHLVVECLHADLDELPLIAEAEGRRDWLLNPPGTAKRR